jgi:DNA-binding MarR family transcriptional regulator
MISSLTRVRKRESGSTDEGRIVLVEPKNKATVEPGQRETRFWLQILSLHGYIFSSLNSILNSQFDLSVAKFDVLAQLDRHKEGMALGQLSQNLRVSGGNVSGLVRRLLADGLISKKMSSDDRRSFIVRLTPKGNALFQKASVVHKRHLVQCFKNASAGELEATSGALKCLSALVHAPKKR